MAKSSTIFQNDGGEGETIQALKYLEAKEHGQAGFPIEIYNVDQHHPRYVMPLHWHHECELILVRKGRLDYEVDFQRGAAYAGDILFVNGGLLHGGMPQNCFYQCVVFSLGALMQTGELCRALLSPYFEGERQVQLHLPAADETLGAVVARLCEVLKDRRPGYALQTHGLLCQTMGHIIEQGYTRRAVGEKSGLSRKLEQLKNALTLIEDEYNQQLTLEQLARAAGMSPKYFCQLFREMTRRSPMDYLNHHRIEAARTMLAGGADNVTEVAYACGFNDLSYFIRVFKRYVGLTPKQYSKSVEKSAG